MKFIQRNVNFGLLFLVVVLAVAIATLGIYYTANYSNLSQEYSRQLTSLQKVTDDLLFHKTRLNQTSVELQTVQQDETVLSQKYNELKEDKESVELANRNLRSELETRTQELIAKTNELFAAQSQIAQKQSEISQLKSDVAYYKELWQDAEDEIDSICATPGNQC